MVGSYTGKTFDDSANQFVLSPYLRVDVSAEREMRWGLSLTAGAQNLLNRRIEAGRTPVLTLAAPRLVEGWGAVEDGAGELALRESAGFKLRRT